MMMSFRLAEVLDGVPVRPVQYEVGGRLLKRCSIVIRLTRLAQYRGSWIKIPSLPIYCY
jgi:hypothetical protein